MQILRANVVCKYFVHKLRASIASFARVCFVGYILGVPGYIPGYDVTRFDTRVRQSINAIINRAYTLGYPGTYRSDVARFDTRVPQSIYATK